MYIYTKRNDLSYLSSHMELKRIDLEKEGIVL